MSENLLSSPQFPTEEGGVLGNMLNRASDCPPTDFEAAANLISKGLKKERISPRIFGGILALIEWMLLVFAAQVIFSIYIGVNSHNFELATLLILLVPAFAIIFFNSAHAYEIQHITRPYKALIKTGVLWLAAIIGAIVLLFLTKQSDAISRIWMTSWALSGLVILFVARMGASMIAQGMQKRGSLEKRAVIVGGGEYAQKIIDALSDITRSGVRICGIFDDRMDDRSPDSLQGYPKLGTFDQLVRFCRVAEIDVLIISLPMSAEKRVLELIREFWVLPLNICLSAYSNKLNFRPSVYSHIGTLPVLDVYERPISDWDNVYKFLFDKIFGVILLILTAPIMIVAALAVKLESKGPVIFKQTRHGFNNELIEVYKFRSMYVEMSNAHAEKLVTKDDPRVTRVGRIIRKTSIDELPQLFNVVFKGNLSLVGPRPHALKAKVINNLYQDVVDGYYARHKVKPGITGWAQINGWRGETDTDVKLRKRVEHDLYYIENWSILFDLYILIMTPVSLILKRDGAY